jgi:hypothetical protein
MSENEKKRLSGGAVEPTRQKKKPWSARKCLAAAFLVWPGTVLVTDLLGWLVPSRFIRSGFSYIALPVTVPVCFVLGLLFIVRGLRRSNGTHLERFLMGLVLIAFYVLLFALSIMIIGMMGRTDGEI